MQDRDRPRDPEQEQLRERIRALAEKSGLPVPTRRLSSLQSPWKMVCPTHGRVYGYRTWRKGSLVDFVRSFFDGYPCPRCGEKLQQPSWLRVQWWG